MIAGTIASGLWIWFFKNYSTYFSAKYRNIPKSLKLFLLTSCLPAALVITFGSIVFSLYFFITNDETDIIFKVIRLTVAMGAQHLRGSLVVLVIERIVSTVDLEKHSRRLPGFRLFFILTLCSYLSSLLYMIPSITFIILHILIIVIAKILSIRNRKMYNLLAYRVSLRQRYQIVENIKILVILWPKIVIFTVVGPLGVIAAATYNFSTGGVAPTCLFLITYNLAFILILMYKMKNIVKIKSRIVSIGEKKSQVISPLGQKLPIYVTTDTYFVSLQQQWN
uniref:G protein-coupled receptor n=1 Tax=Panagrolaimus sp. PS1159 TaxID=55785 RepID=A0AC35GW32_9BILA